MNNFGLDKEPFLSEEDTQDIFNRLQKVYWGLKIISATLRDRADNNTAEIIDELRDAVGDGVCLVGLFLRVDEEA